MSTSLYILLLSLAAVHVIAAFAASVTVLRDKSLETFQVVAKLLISWVLLFGGPLFILNVMSEHSPELLPRWTKKAPARWLLFTGPDTYKETGDRLGHDDGGIRQRDASDVTRGAEGTCGVVDD